MNELTKARIDVVKCEMNNLRNSAKEIQDNINLEVVAKQEKSQKGKEMMPVYEAAIAINEVIKLLDSSLIKFK